MFVADCFQRYSLFDAADCFVATIHGQITDSAAMADLSLRFSVPVCSSPESVVTEIYQNSDWRESLSWQACGSLQPKAARKHPYPIAHLSEPKV
ncbi:hypothetical protein Tco_0929244 [Tanacetum coccineum]